MKFRADNAHGEIMNCPKKRNLTVILSVALVLLGTSVTAFAQTTQTQNQTDPSQAQNAQQANQGNDLRQLGLTPDQIQKIRAINLDLKDERQAANMKLREAQRALTEAVESPECSPGLSCAREPPELTARKSEDGRLPETGPSLNWI